MARVESVSELRKRLAARAAADRNKDHLIQKLRGAASKQMLPAAANGYSVEPSVSRSSSPRFRIEPKRLGKIKIVQKKADQYIPHLVSALLKILLQSVDQKPICILLPSTESVAEFVALLAAFECLAVDYRDRRAAFFDQLRPGRRLRALPDGNVFLCGQRKAEFGQDGIYLHYTEKDSLESNGCHWIRIDEALRYEPTTRKIPISRSSTKLSKPRPSLIDELADVQAFGNTALYQTRVAIVGTRADFDRTLGSVDLIANGGHTSPGELQYSFAWGAFDESGESYVLHPTGAEGAPLVAIAADFDELEKTALGRQTAPGSQVVISSRLELVLRSLDLVNRIAERQHMVLLVDARRRKDIIPLRRHGWHLWEPQPQELLPGHSKAPEMRTGIIGLDRTLRCAAAERDPIILFAGGTSASLTAAFESLRDVGDRIRTTEAAAFDDRVQEGWERSRVRH